MQRMAPQDEVLWTLMVRSAATPRVSNHEAHGTDGESATLEKCLLLFRRHHLLGAPLAEQRPQ